MRLDRSISRVLFSGGVLVLGSNRNSRLFRVSRKLSSVCLFSCLLCSRLVSSRVICIVLNSSSVLVLVFSCM